MAAPVPEFRAWVQRLSVRFQSFRSGQSQMSFLGFAHSFFLSYLPRPRVVPTWSHPEALYTAPVKRGISTKVSIRTGATLYRSCQSCGSRRRASERMCEARFGIRTHG